jgi:hypothetical protein
MRVFITLELVIQQTMVATPCEEADLAAPRGLSIRREKGTLALMLRE